MKSLEANPTQSEFQNNSKSFDPTKTSLLKIQELLNWCEKTLFKKNPQLLHHVFLLSLLERFPNLVDSPLLQTHPILLNHPVVRQEPESLSVPMFQNNPELFDKPLFQKFPRLTREPVLSRYRNLIDARPVLENPDLIYKESVQLLPELLAHPLVVKMPQLLDLPPALLKTDFLNHPFLKKNPGAALNPVFQAHPEYGNIQFIVVRPTFLNHSLLQKYPELLSHLIFKLQPQLLDKALFSKHPELAIHPLILNHPELIDIPVVATNPELLEVPAIRENPNILIRLNSNEGGGIFSSAIFKEHPAWYDHPILKKHPELWNSESLRTNPNALTHPWVALKPDLLLTPLFKYDPYYLDNPLFQADQQLIFDQLMIDYPQYSRSPILLKYPFVLIQESIRHNPSLLANQWMINHPILSLMPEGILKRNSAIEIYKPSQDKVLIRVLARRPIDLPTKNTEHCQKISNYASRFPNPKLYFAEYQCRNFKNLADSYGYGTLTTLPINPALDLNKYTITKWVAATEVDIFIAHNAQPASHKFSLYRWGDAPYELARTKHKIGKGKPAFDINTVNQPGHFTTAGRGLYASAQLDHCAQYGGHLDRRYNDASLMEIRIPKGTLIINPVSDPLIIRKMQQSAISLDAIYRSHAPVVVKYAWRSQGTEAYVIKTPYVHIKHFRGKSLSINELRSACTTLKEKHGEGAAHYFENLIQPELSKRVYFPNALDLDVGRYSIETRIPLDRWKENKKLASQLERRDTILRKIEKIQSGFSSHSESVQYFWKFDGSCGAYYVADELYLYQDQVASEKCREVFPTQYVWDAHGTCVERVIPVWKTPYKVDPPEAPIIGSVAPGLCQADLVCEDYSTWNDDLYSIIDKSRSHIESFNKQKGYTAKASCKRAVALAKQTGLLCIPSKNSPFAEVISTHSLIKTFDHQFENIDECFQALESSPKEDKVMCVPQNEGFQWMSYEDPYQHRVIPSEALEVEIAKTLDACYAQHDADFFKQKLKLWVTQQNVDQQSLARKWEPSGFVPLDDVRQIYPYIKSLLDADAQVSEGWTVQEHTERVLYQLDTEIDTAFLDVFSNHHPEFGNVKFLFRALITLHDIGKPLGLKKFQHAFTTPILVHFLTRWGLSPAQVNLAFELVNHDLIGEMLKNTPYRTPNTTLVVFSEKAKRLNITPQEFFKLQEIFYSADASSYPKLRAQVFTEHGFLKILKYPSYLKLQELLNLI